jgi:WD40 repeat protein
VRFSPDGKLLAGAGYEVDDSNVWHPVAKLWQTTGLKQVNAFRPKTPLKASARFTTPLFTPDGKTLIVGAVTGKAKEACYIHFWDVDSGKLLHTLQPAEGKLDDAAATFFHVALAPDGKTLACYGSIGDAPLLVLYDLDKKFQKRVLASSQPGFAVAFSPDGATLATGDKKGAVALWSVTSGEMLASYEAHQNSVECLGFSPDGQALASGSTDSKLILWDVVKKNSPK